MPLSGAEQQRRYRERHHDDLARATLDVRLAVRDRLDRLAWHFHWSLTQLVEELAGRAEFAVEAELSGAALKAYRDAGYEDDPAIAVYCAPLPSRPCHCRQGEHARSLSERQRLSGPPSRHREQQHHHVTTRVLDVGMVHQRPRGR
jgi:hypothetical protein